MESKSSKSELVGFFKLVSTFKSCLLGGMGILPWSPNKAPKGAWLKTFSVLIFEAGKLTWLSL